MNKLEVTKDFKTGKQKKYLKENTDCSNYFKIQNFRKRIKITNRNVKATHRVGGYIVV